MKQYIVILIRRLIISLRKHIDFINNLCDKYQYIINLLILLLINFHVIMNKFNPFDNFMSFMKRDFTTFNMSNYHPTSTQLGRLLPIRSDLVLPADYWKGNVNLACYTAPLVAPAFTQIKAVTNAFYVSYPSIWKYWNQFISNRPSDAYLSSQNVSAYSNVYSEPCIPAPLIQLICKVALGYAKITDATTVLSIEPHDIYLSHGTYVLDETNGIRTYYYTAPDSNMPDNSLGSLGLVLTPNISDAEDFCQSIGFDGLLSFFVHQCKEIYANLKAFGIPCDLMAECPMNTYTHETISALPFMAYSKIWQEYFRNNQVQGTELNYFEVNGILCDWYTPNGAVDYSATIHQKGWQLRLNDMPYNYQRASYIGIHTIQQGNGVSINYSEPLALLTGVGLREFIISEMSSTETAILPNYYNGLLVAKYRNFEQDYFNSAAIDPMQGRTSLPVPSTLEELRSTSKLEEFLERNTAARNFFDFLKSHFGTKANSVVYGRPDLLGTSITNVNISDTLQTSSSDGTSPQGNRSGVASAFGSNQLISKQFDEHGIIITLLSFVLDNQYFQGLPFIFEQHKDYLSYPFPEFANLGLEKIENQEIFYGKNSYDSSLGSDLSVIKDGIVKPNNPLGNPDATDISLHSAFGYTPRYSRFKCKLDQLSGEFTNRLSFWHTYRDFSNSPTLSHEFVSYQNAIFMSHLDRIFATVADKGDKFFVNTYNDFSVSRCLPLVGNPQLD